MAGRLVTVRRLGWGIADQALSSLTNFALALVVARSVSPRELGAFALVFATYTLGLGATRSLVTDALLIRASGGEVEDWRASSAGATWLCLTGACAAAAVVVVPVALVVGGTVGSGLLALAVTLPGLLLQDAWRYVFFSGGLGSRAFVNDLAWAAALLPALVVLVATDRESVGWFVLAWGAAGSAAGVLGMAQAGFLPKPATPRSWWRRHRDLSSRLFGEFVAWHAATQLSLYGVAAIAGVPAVGSIRAAEVAFGPVNVLQTGMGLVAVPEGVRAVERSPARLRALVAAVAALVGGSALVVGGLLLAAPDGVGRAILKQNWPGARSILAVWMIVRIASGVVAAAGVGLRSLAAAGRSLRARVCGDALLLAAALTGAAVNGLRGAVAGTAVGTVVSAAIWTAHFDRALRARARGDVVAPPGPAGPAMTPAPADVPGTDL